MPDAITLRQADSLYPGFPDFSAWPAPTEDDLRLWDRFASRLEETRQKATPDALKKAVEVAVRAAALDTGAIEGLYSVDRGFTMTVATQALAWEHAIEEKGENVRALFEAQLEAYELVIDAVTRTRPISEAWIRALHEKVCAGQEKYRVLTDQGWQEQELPRGTYKTQPNHVRLSDGTMHPYAPVDRVASEMHRLLEQVRTPEFEAAHPIAQASYVHYGFVVIHPFADGNGRVARALASVFFYRALSIPFLVFANQRNAYFDALHQADLGAGRPLLTFFRDRGIDTIQLVVDNLMTAEAPAPDVFVSQMSKKDDTAERLLSIAKEQVQAQGDELNLPEHLQFAVLEVALPYWQLTPGYRAVERKKLDLIVSIRDKRRNLFVSSGIRVLVALNESDPFAFLIEVDNNNDQLEVRLEDAFPEVSDSLRLRLTNWTRRLIGRLIEEWKTKAW